MASNSHFLLDLAGGAGFFSASRMSLLMEASNVLVGTFFKSFFLPSSTGGLR